jgi:hypothetical protein
MSDGAMSAPMTLTYLSLYVFATASLIPCIVYYMKSRLPGQDGVWREFAASRWGQAAIFGSFLFMILRWDAMIIIVMVTVMADLAMESFGVASDGRPLDDR